jgi:two-component system, LytTR family, response regulator
MLRAIITDDEPNSRNALRQKLNNHCPQVTVIAEFEDGEQALAGIPLLQPDLVFLDVEMPRMNGFTLLQNLQYRDFELIFTTAYDHYAVKAIRFSALDYLVKPVEIADLKDAVAKAAEKRAQGNHNERLATLLQNMSTGQQAPQRIAIPSMEGIQFVNLADILYVEANSNYTRFYLDGNRCLTVSKTMKDFEELLPATSFVRIHHSHIINKNQIEKYIRGEGGQVVMKNGAVLDVSRRKKDDFLKSMG